MYHLLDGNTTDLVEVIDRVEPIDIAFLGIGENGHIAFNDPPADFTTEDPYIIVSLDETCRRQQVGEAWFGDLSEVPTQEISMSVRQILKSKEILAVVPDTPQSPGGQEMLRTGRQSDGAGLYPPNARQRNHISRQGFRVVVKYCVAKSTGRIANHKLANCAVHTISMKKPVRKICTWGLGKASAVCYQPQALQTRGTFSGSVASRQG